MSNKIATFKDLDTLASLDTGTSAGYISGAKNEQCVTKGNFDIVSTETIAAKGNGLMFVDDSDSSNYESNRLILLDDVKYISEITAVLVSAPNIPAEGGIACATWLLTQYYKTTGGTQPLRDEWTVDGSNVSADSKGTTPSDVTNVANSTITVTRNGKSISLSQMIKQDSNEIISYGGWSAPTVTVSPNSFAAAGGTGTITISGDCKRENTWSSGGKSTDIASISSVSATLGTVSSDYKTLSIGVNTLGSSKNGKVTIKLLFDGSVVKTVESNIYTQVAQTTCTMTLTGSTEAFHGTATITGVADVAGKIYWGTANNNMPNVVIVSDGVSVEITNRTSLGTTTIYAYFVPSDSNFTSLGSETSPHTSASAIIKQATDASISITTSNATYNGSAQTVVTCNPTDGVHGVSDWAIGYTTSKDDTVSSVIWASSKTNLTLTNVGTYYIWKKWTADSNHSNSSSGEKIDATVVISKKSVTFTATSQNKVYDGTALTVANTATPTTGGYLVSGHTASFTCSATSVTNVGSSTKSISNVTIKDGSGNVVTGNYNITKNTGTLSVTARPVTFTATSQNKVYDGTALTADNKATLTSGTLVSGHTASFTCSGTITNYSSTGATKTLSSVVINDGSGNVVTDNYNITKKNGTLTINKATPTLTLAGSNKTYDGKAAYITGTANVPGKIYYNTTSYNGSYTVNLNNQWRLSSTISNPNSSNYEGVYESFSNYNVDSGVAIMTITISGYKKFSLYIRSYAESNYDYVMVGQLDKAITGSTSYSSSDVKSHTRGNQQSGTAISNYTLVEFDNMTGGTHTITIVFRKDGSVNNNDDRGYILISKNNEIYSDTLVVNAFANTAVNLYSRTDVGTLTVNTYFEPTDTTNYNSLGSSSNYYASKSITITQATPTLTFTASTSTLTYSGLAQDIGTISYTGDGKFYYVVSTSTTVPTSGWTVVPSGTTTTIKSSAATAATYYVYLKSDAGTNYAAASAANKGNKEIGKANGSITFEPADISVQCKNSSTQMTALDVVTCTSATGATGTVTYTLNTGSTTLSNCSLIGTKLTVLKETPVGEYTISITAKSAATTNYNSASTTSEFTLEVLADILGDPVGTLSISDSSTKLSAGADTRTITWGAVHQTWTHGGENKYPEVTATLTQSCSNNIANTYVTIDNTSYTNNSSTTESTLTKKSYNNFAHTAGATFTYTLKLGDVVIERLRITAEANTASTTDTGITAYGTPTITIGDGLTAAGGSATVTCTVKNTMGTKTVYTSGYTTTSTKQVDGSASWSIVSQSCAGGGTRFTKSGNTLVHSTMGTNEGVDTVSLKSVNNGDTTKTNSNGKGVVNYKQHTLTGMNVLYNNALPSNGSTSSPNVTYSTSYVYLSGASGSTTSGNTLSSIGVGTTFTKTFSIEPNLSGVIPTYAFINSSTGVITWTENTTVLTRSVNILCEGVLTSQGLETNKSVLSLVSQTGNTSTYRTQIQFVNTNDLASQISYVIYVNNSKFYTTRTNESAGTLLATGVFDTVLTNIEVRAKNNGNNTGVFTLKVTYNGSGGSVESMLPPSGSSSISSSTSSIENYTSVSFTLRRNDLMNCTGAVQISISKNNIIV